MLAYNTRLAWLSLRQRPGLTLLSIAAIAIGLGVLMTIQTQAYQMRSLPVGEDSKDIYLVQLDNRDISEPAIEHANEMPSLTYADASSLVGGPTIAQYATTTWRTRGIVNTIDQSLDPIRGVAVATNHNFFRLFNTPFLYGTGWGAEADNQVEAVVVISRQLNQQLFGGDNSVGNRIRVIGQVATVIGVLDEWPVKSAFYYRDFSRGASDDIFLPQSFALDVNLPRYTTIECRPADRPRMPLYRLGPPQLITRSECAWVNLWVKLDSESDVREYQDYMADYVSEQKALGRFPRPENNFLENIVSHQAAELNSDNRFELYVRMAWLFAAVCLLNTIIIMLARYIRKTKEIAVRRALGANRRTLIVQYLIELILVGVVGAIAGILIAYAGLQSMLEVYLYSTDYAFPRSAVSAAYTMDWKLLSTAILIGITGTVLAGLYPVWRVCNLPPAPQLKTE